MTEEQIRQDTAYSGEIIVEEGRSGSDLFRSIVAMVVPLILTAALVAVCFWGSSQAARADALETRMQASYRHNFYELSDNVHDMQIALKKLSVAGSRAQHVRLLQDVRRLSGEAVANLGNLPAAHTETVELTRFVIQTGDYAESLAVKILDGGVPTAEDREQVQSLYEASVGLASRLEERLQSGDLPIESIDADGYFGGTESAADADAAIGAADDPRASNDPNRAENARTSDAGTAGEDGETATADRENIANYPTLIYDGPFSDSTEKAEPRGLSDESIDVGEALQRAVDFLGGAYLEAAGETGGSIETFDFTGHDVRGRSVEISVAKRGGAILQMMADVQGAAEGVPDEETRGAYEQAAEAFLESRGYERMQSSYAQYYAGIAVFNFAATQDGIILYPDLVKVYIERQSGEVIGIDARNYLFSHAKRTLDTPLISEEEARGMLSDALKIESVRLALIPRTVNTELLCYECTGTYGDATFAVYINALTGAEEQIFEIINSDEGEFTV